MWTRAAVGGSNTRLRLVALLPQVGSAGCKERLSSAQHSRFGVGAFVQPSSLHPSPCRGQAASLCLLLFGYTTWSPSSAPVLLVCDLFLPWSGHSVGGHSLWQKSTSPRVEFKCTKQNIWCEES